MTTDQSVDPSANHYAKAVAADAKKAALLLSAYAAVEAGFPQLEGESLLAYIERCAVEDFSFDSDGCLFPILLQEITSRGNAAPLPGDDEPEVPEIKWTPEMKQQLAILFRQYLQRDLGPENYALACRLNATEADPKVCHTHDFIDANMTMAEAFVEVVGAAVDLRSTGHADLWNAAWNEVRAEMVAEVGGPVWPAPGASAPVGGKLMTAAAAQRPVGVGAVVKECVFSIVEQAGGTAATGERLLRDLDDVIARLTVIRGDAAPAADVAAAAALSKSEQASANRGGDAPGPGW